MGNLGAAVSIVFGWLFIAAAFAAPIIYCSSWRDAYLVDGVLCFPIAAAEASDREDVAKAVAIVASIIFAVSIRGTLTGRASC